MKNQKSWGQIKQTMQERDSRSGSEKHKRKMKYQEERERAYVDRQTAS